VEAPRNGHAPGGVEEANSAVEVPSLDEAGLVDLARSGDHEAFAQLVQQHADLAFRTAYLCCGTATRLALSGDTAAVLRVTAAG
jgi:hypothetical protein